ncbi:Flavin-dependent monooxygenase, oxygenase subunit HsaA [compost metagenome]
MTTSAELIGRARELLPVLKARAAETEALRRPHDDTINDLIDAGILQMLVPKRWGGAESDLKTMFEVVDTLAQGCISTAWIAAFYIGHNLYAAKMTPKAQETLFGARGFVLLPAASAPTMKAEPVDGGWVITGRAPWGSGVMHADWVMVSGMTPDKAPRSFVMPVSDVTVDDTWRFSGMAGTGSNDIVAEGVFVPDHMSLDGADLRKGATEGTALHDNPLYAIPLVPMAYATIVPVLTGGLKGALSAFEDIVDRRVRNFSGAVVKDQQHTHIVLGEMQVGTQAVDILGRAHVARTEALVQTGFTTDDRISLKGSAGYLARTGREVSQNMMANAGSSNYHHDQPLQRFWRDLATVTSHAFWDWDIAREQVGRRHFGLPINHPIV